MSKKILEKNISEGVKTNIDILNIKFSESFYTAFGNKSQREKLEYFAQLGIIHNNAKCSCTHEMGLRTKKRVVDGFVWFCSACKKEKTCRYDSVFMV